jgi:hypothetical protein
MSLTVPYKIGTVAMTIVVAIALTSCSRYRDALIFNPCQSSIVVSFSSAATAPAISGEWFDSTPVGPESALTVPGVFGDASGAHAGWVKVEVGETGSRVESVSYPDEGPIPVLVPARFCVQN